MAAEAEEAGREEVPEEQQPEGAVGIFAKGGRREESYYSEYRSCDGRGANAQFLKDNFKRKWEYLNDKKNDQHIFWLTDSSLGKYNDLQIKFYNKK